jgi:hypothetical protein
VPTISVRLTVLESRQSEKITGARFTIGYATGRNAEISMMEIPAVSGSHPFDDFRAELDQLGKALRDAAAAPGNMEIY